MEQRGIAKDQEVERYTFLAPGQATAYFPPALLAKAVRVFVPSLTQKSQR